MTDLLKTAEALTFAALGSPCVPVPVDTLVQAIGAMSLAHACQTYDRETLTCHGCPLSQAQAALMEYVP